MDIAQFLEQQQISQRLMDSFSSSRRMAEALQATTAVGQNALNEFIELDASSRKLQSHLNESKLLADFNRARSVADAYHSAINVRDLFGTSRHLAEYAIKQEDFQKQLQAITSPSIQLREKFDSLTSIAKLSALGHAIDVAAPFDRSMTQVLQETLGRWATPIEPSADILAPIARVEAYRSRGFDSALTDFPAGAFGEVLSATDIGFDVSLPSSVLLRPVWKRKAKALSETGDDDLLVLPEENQRAYQLFFFLERTFRQQIEEKMAERYGPDWYKRLDEKTLKRWQQGAERAHANGRSGEALIEYSTLRDYERIITDDEHWEEVFQFSFRRRESVLESFYRLSPVRHSTMHCRVLTREEYLTLFVEARLLLRALGVPLSSH